MGLRPRTLRILGLYGAGKLNNWCVWFVLRAVALVLLMERVVGWSSGAWGGGVIAVVGFLGSEGCMAYANPFISSLGWSGEVGYASA
jgi:hypothetical protein